MGDGGGSPDDVYTMEVALPYRGIVCPLIGRAEMYYEDETCILNLTADIQKM